MDRQTIRQTAGRWVRNGEVVREEREGIAEFLRANPAIGNPHLVKCDWCHESTMLFRDEDMGTFTRTPRGWRCTKCDEHAGHQEVRF